VLGIEICKSYFLHYFNAAENQSYVGPLLQQDYDRVYSMVLKEKKAILDMYTHWFMAIVGGKRDI